jgi:hypothetical protein
MYHEIGHDPAKSAAGRIVATAANSTRRYRKANASEYRRRPQTAKLRGDGRRLGSYALRSLVSAVAVAAFDLPARGARAANLAQSPAKYPDRKAKTTYVLAGGADHFRRIFTDGRDWPKEIEPT